MWSVHTPDGGKLQFCRNVDPETAFKQQRKKVMAMIIVVRNAVNQRWPQIANTASASSISCKVTLILWWVMRMPMGIRIHSRVAPLRGKGVSGTFSHRHRKAGQRISPAATAMALVPTYAAVPGTSGGVSS